MGKIRGLALAWALMAAAGAMAAVKGSATLTGEFETTQNIEKTPSRVVVAGNLVFALETGASRIAVTNLATGAAMSYYGTTIESGDIGVNYTDSSAARKRLGNKVVWTQGSGNGGFKMPDGLALDTFGGVANRLAVADTGNNRVQLFTFDGGTGEISFESAYAGSGADALSEPSAVAFMDGGDLLVADKGTSRVVRLSYAGGAWSQVAAYEFGNDCEITGVCYDKDTEDGFWVAMAQGQYQCVSFHHFSDFNAQQPVVALGTPFTASALSSPNDVQAWKVDGSNFVVVAGYGNSRVNVLHLSTGASGGYSRLSVAAEVGSDARTDNNNDEVFNPRGVFPVQGEAVLYVADTGHNKVKRYGMAFEEVEDPEVTETVPWDIASFSLAAGGDAATIGWVVPGANLPAGGEDLEFRLDYRPTLTDGDWSETAVRGADNPFTVGQGESGVHEETLDLTGLPGHPTAGFFRLWWLNKVAE